MSSTPTRFHFLDFDLVVMDMAGTTVRDDGVVESAFAAVAVEHGLAPDEHALRASLEYVRATMGRSKIEVFGHLAGGDAGRAAVLNESFEAAYAAAIESEGVAEVPGAEAAIRSLTGHGMAVVLTTGFAPATRELILERLGWRGIVDDALSPADVGRGRPHPDLPLTALLRVRGRSVGSMVVVGDTISDIMCGCAAGAGLVVGVASGTHCADDLAASGADMVLDSVAELPAMLGLA